MPTPLAPAGGTGLPGTPPPGALPPGVAGLLERGAADGRLRHLEHLPARPGSRAPWPTWADPAVVDALRTTTGGADPWGHQVRVAEAVHAGCSTVVSAGTASGKTLAFLLPVLSGLRASQADGSRSATALYLSPTKALAADQEARVRGLHLPGVQAATYDGDTSTDLRGWIRQHANLVLSNVDMLHRSVLPGHEHWSSFLRRLRYVVIDECHAYRGVFGAHVAAVLRRLRRVAARYGAHPTFVLASATVADPATTARRLTGLPVRAVTQDDSARPPVAVGLWEPPTTTAPEGEPVRRTATAEASGLLGSLVGGGASTLAFVRSRTGAESVAAGARRRLAEHRSPTGARPEHVAAYRGGYLPEERRALEAALRTGTLRGLATTRALELGIDVTGLDAVVVAGWPGTRASFWQQVGRAGRRDAPALGLLVAREDPLDTYLVNHPDALFGTGVEAAVLDPDNPYVLAPHLCAAAAELPLTEADLDLFGPSTADVLELLTRRRLLRRRSTGWYWTRRDRASDLTDLRGTGGTVRVVETGTGRVLGTVDAGSADSAVHTGAVHTHQGETFVVDRLDLEESAAFVHAEATDHTTHATSDHAVRILSTDGTTEYRGRGDGAGGGPLRVSTGVVEVTSQVTGFLRRRVGSGEVLGRFPLDLPERRLRTRAVWWTLPDGVAESVLDGDPGRVPGALHAAEHAAIGLLPLLATCDRWDLGGLSTARHPDTGRPTVFVHDSVPGGAGYADRGHQLLEHWLRATRDAVRGCPCESGCPSCVQSPKCGNGNEPLDKAGAVAVLDLVVAHLGGPPTPVPTGGDDGRPDDGPAEGPDHGPDHGPDGGVGPRRHEPVLVG
ncbi:DEAD/DEAH box helicase [Kineococcus gynurae]|uniref:DEAD/DEAH box helicase n=1 Tax=Kineococcus gynurae TaxID=452979 RepID=A0ABV5LU00_9ACTN